MKVKDLGVLSSLFALRLVTSLAWAQNTASGGGSNPANSDTDHDSLYVGDNGNTTGVSSVERFGDGPDTGSVRRYDVGQKTYDVFVKAGGRLVAGWYLTFGDTDTATLNYR